MASILLLEPTAHQLAALVATWRLIADHDGAEDAIFGALDDFGDGAAHGLTVGDIRATADWLDAAVRDRDALRRYLNDLVDALADGDGPLVERLAGDVLGYGMTAVRDRAADRDRPALRVVKK